LGELNGDQIGRLVYLVLLGTVLVGYALVARRNQLGAMLRNLLLWGLIITGVAAAWGLWDGMQRPGSSQMVSTGQALEVRRGRDGHFRMELEITAQAGGPVQRIGFIVDTGASDLVLAPQDAQKLGFGADDLAFLGTARTANGVVRTAQVRLHEVAAGGASHSNVRALVNEGELHVSLLGMAYLSRFSRIEIAGDRLRLEY
jgi:aspartyl protease family protein